MYFEFEKDGKPALCYLPLHKAIFTLIFGREVAKYVPRKNVVKEKAREITELNEDLKYALAVAKTLCTQNQRETTGCSGCYLFDWDTRSCDVCEVLNEIKERYK